MGNRFCAETQLAQIGIKIFYRLETKVSPHRAGFCYKIREYLCCLLLDLDLHCFEPVRNRFSNSAPEEKP